MWNWKQDGFEMRTDSQSTVDPRDYFTTHEYTNL